MTQGQALFEAARLYYKIERECHLYPVTFAVVKLNTSKTREENKTKLLEAKNHIIANAHRIVEWAKTENRTELERVTARSYYRNQAALLERCNQLLNVCGYVQKEIE